MPGFRFGDDQRVPLAAFAQSPPDARSACVAVIDMARDVQRAVSDCRPLGAPVVLVCCGDQLQWWNQRAGDVELNETVPAADVPRFFRRHSQEFGPEAVYRAKVWGRCDFQYQLSFVDIGLMPLVEEEIGRKLEELIVRSVMGLKALLGWQSPSEEQGHWLLQTVFWLVSAKMLRDKELENFADLALTDVEEVFRRLAGHYKADEVPVHNARERGCLEQIAEDIEAFSRLNLATTEALAYIYENALISRETRSALGTHSTPPYLVDYILGNLRPWIEEIPSEERNVFEPACGHAAFLVSAMRLMTELLPAERAAPAKRRQYLRSRLHGCDVDSFALEVARLALTLTDIPNPDGWDLQLGNMFSPGALEAQARRATILLANPPFQNFTPKERDDYRQRGVEAQYVNRTAEVMGRTLPHLPSGAVFGFVVPQGLLHSANARNLRQLLLDEFEIKEICLFPDKVFAFSDMESAIVLGRRPRPRQPPRPELRYRRVRERDLGSFKFAYAATSQHFVDRARFGQADGWDMRIPDLEVVWECCQNLPRLSDIAELGQGLAYKSTKDLPKGTLRYSRRRFSGAGLGFLHFDIREGAIGPGEEIASFDDFPRRPVGLHELPTAAWLNLDPEVILRHRTGSQTGVPQVLLNYARASRGPWRLKALIDRAGHAVASRFITVRPLSSDTPLEFLWAVCNSPLANAFAYCHLGKRDNLVGDIRRVPVPQVSRDDMGKVASAAQAYLEVVHGMAPGELLQGGAPPGTLSEKLLRVDAEVLRLYDLPAALERQLLDLFAGWKRVGVPFEFDRYFPEGFEPEIGLRDYLAISIDWEETNRRRGELIQRKADGVITKAEQRELGGLQDAATNRRRLVAPYPMRELDRLEEKLAGKEQ